MASMDTAQVLEFLSAGTRTGKLAWVGSDGHPHVAPIWFVVDGDSDEFTLVLNTGEQTAKGRAMRRDPRVGFVVDDDTPPFSFVKINGTAELSDDIDEVRRWATEIGGRYMGADRAEEFGARNGVPGELLVRIRPTKIIAEADLAD